MSRERELLQRVLDGDANRHWTISSRLYKKIEAVLAEPEQKPLTREKISYGAESSWARALIASQDQADIIIKELQELLAQPEQEPLSNEEVFDIGYKAGFTSSGDKGVV
jgi:hypothetical protein